MASEGANVGQENPASSRKHALHGSSSRASILRRKVRVRDAQSSTLIAYDLETTNIARGTPRPLYLTAFSEALGFSFASVVRDIAHLRELLIEHFLTPANVGARFVAWNGNNFDAYLIAAALIQEPGYVIRPFLTRSKNLRGMLVIVAGDESLKPKEQRAWAFVDGIAMLGLAGTSLAKFLKVFAPDWQKLESAINFEHEAFDPSNADHRAYAMRDSEGLYYGINRAEAILLSHFNEPLGVTMGRACIKILTAHIPENVSIIQPNAECLRVIRSYVMRGGFCHCVRPYRGPVWKYDINQAYAAAMRDAKLPDGRCFRSPNINRFAQVYIARIRARHVSNNIPFYFKTANARGVPVAVFDAREIADTWLTSIEIEQLRTEGWSIEVLDSYFWEGVFDLREYVTKLEHIRSSCEGGPSGAIGTMIKAVGNHSYGKTVEQLDPLELLIAKECPEGFAQYFPENASIDETFFPHIFYRRKEDADNLRDYHQPHIGAFITAHVRMLVRQAALIAPDAWLYADTDCVMFDADVTRSLDIDSRRYGAFKIEASGDPYILIAKKVYSSNDGVVKHAKGLNVKRLTPADFAEWYAGRVPEQSQIQRANFVRVMRGAAMYSERKRKGTNTCTTL